jgi:hypothetical protein
VNAIEGFGRIALIIACHLTAEATMPKAVWPDTLSTEDRIDLAQAKTRQAVAHLLEILALHENNAIIVYSDKLAKQIPKSRGANAFNTFQQSMHRYEIVRICALWDSKDSAKENISTIVELIRPDAVIGRLGLEMEKFWGDFGGSILNPSDDLELAEIEKQVFLASEREFGRKQAAKVRRKLRGAINLFDKTHQSPKVVALHNLRDKRLAHLLSHTRREKHGPIEAVKYGDESKLLDISVRIMEALYLGVCGTSFNFGDSRQIDRRYAKALWGACTFKGVK